MARNYHRRRAVSGGMMLLLRLTLTVTLALTATLLRGCPFAVAFCPTRHPITGRNPPSSVPSMGQTAVPSNVSHRRHSSSSYRGNPFHVLLTPRGSRLDATTALSLSPLLLSGEEFSLLVWITAFSVSHIGMSAIRQTLITNVFGEFLARDRLGMVGTGKFRLPDVWPGDSSGTNELFPDVETTGRQLYRIFYTIVSFWTLGNAFGSYLAIRNNNNSSPADMLATTTAMMTTATATTTASVDDPLILLSYGVATLAGAFSLASGVNASPLGLMPSFRPTGDNDGTNTNQTTPTAAAGDTLLGITRDDRLKFDPKGLTRITRHPLILPVAPWGIANAVLLGGHTADAILFGGLSLYSVAGCYCQDLRVLRDEGSVGTTFFETPETGQPSQTQQDLRSFYDQTSFLPFQALLDGRQSWASMIREFPVLAFLVAIPTAFAIETAFLGVLGVDYGVLVQ